jgi:3-hydroxyisobutyrate dehydrogenase
MNVAFLGLGAIGRPMAARIIAGGHALTVWNRTTERARSFADETGARLASSPADAARGAQVIITCLPTSADVEGLLGGSDGLLAGVESGATLVDCTSGDPAGCQRIAQRLTERGASFLDAPVSGGTTGAQQGTLTVMIGGEAEVIARVRPVLESFGKNIVHCGGIGAGDAVKAVNNALLAVHVWTTAEGLTTLAKAGIDPAVALQVINASSGRSNTSMNLFPERVLTRAFPRTFRLALLEKDLGIAAGVARDQRVPTPMLQLASELFRIARSELGEVADHVEATRLVEQWAGAEILPHAES